MVWRNIILDVIKILPHYYAEANNDSWTLYISIIPEKVILRNRKQLSIFLIHKKTEERLTQPKFFFKWSLFYNTVATYTVQC